MENAPRGPQSGVREVPGGPIVYGVRKFPGRPQSGIRYFPVLRLSGLSKVSGKPSGCEAGFW